MPSSVSGVSMISVCMSTSAYVHRVFEVENTKREEEWQQRGGRCSEARARTKALSSSLWQNKYIIEGILNPPCCLLLASDTFSLLTPHFSHSTLFYNLCVLFHFTPFFDVHLSLFTMLFFLCFFSFEPLFNSPFLTLTGRRVYWHRIRKRLWAIPQSLSDWGSQ